jgi:hypothetical protein
MNLLTNTSILTRLVAIAPDGDSSKTADYSSELTMRRVSIV